MILWPSFRKELAPWRISFHVDLLKVQNITDEPSPSSPVRMDSLPEMHEPPESALQTQSATMAIYGELQQTLPLLQERSDRAKDIHEEVENLDVDDLLR